jgi:hypothetical protein
LRLEGVVQITEEPGPPLVMHGMRHVMHPAVRVLLSQRADSHGETKY